VSATSDTGHIRGDAARIAEIVASNPDAAVPGCPGWDVRALVAHLGAVHRWVTECVETSAHPARARATDPLPTPPPEDPADLAQWLTDGATAMTDALDGRDPIAPTWTPFRVERPTVSFWTRRQTHETSVHRIDAESAVGSRTSIEPVIAADGVDEYLELILPRRALPVPAGRAHLHCTDTAGEWTVESDADGRYVLDREHRKGDAAVRGAAEHLLLLLWGRDVPAESIEVVGDTAVAAAWTGIGGI